MVQYGRLGNIIEVLADFIENMRPSLIVYSVWLRKVAYAR